MPGPNKTVHLRKMALTALALTVLGLSPEVSADEFHYTNQLIGNRASGLAGAYTAISDDPAGLYYNPAGIVYAQANNLTASVNAFTVINKSYDSVLSGTYDWKRQSKSLMPNYFGITQPLWKGMVGFSFAVPDSIVEDQDQTFMGFPSSIEGVDIAQYTININKQDETYKFGPSFALEITDNFSIGYTLYYHNREKDYIKNEYVMLAFSNNGNYNDYEWTNHYVETKEKGVENMLGLMWSPVKKLSLGLRLSKVTILSAETTSQLTYRSEIFGGISNTPPPRTEDAKPLEEKRHHPINARLGVAYFVNNSLLVSGDFSYYTATDEVRGTDGGIIFNGTQATWDAALGVEWFITNKFALRSGLFTQNANTPELAVGITDQDEHVDMNGFTLSLTRFTKNSTITGGIIVSAGSGESQVFSGQGSVQSVDILAYTGYLATSYNY